MIKLSQKILLFIVFVLGVAISLLLVKQQQDIRQRATDNDASSVSVCSTNGTVDISVSFTNTSITIVNVVARDNQTGEELTLGIVNPGETVNGKIETVVSSLDQSTVTFTTSTGETKTVTYAPLVCDSTINSCEIKEAECSWDTLDNTTQYKVTVRSTDTGDIVKDGIVNHPTNRFTFPSEAGKGYSCEVTPVNSCGDGETASGEGTCPIPTPTEIPNITLVPTDSTITPSDVQATATLTPVIPTDVQPTATLTPVTSTNVQATATVIPVTPTTRAQSTITNNQQVFTKNTPTPTAIKELPATGYPQNILLMTVIGSALVLMGAFVVIFLW